MCKPKNLNNVKFIHFFRLKKFHQLFLQTWSRLEMNSIMLGDVQKRGDGEEKEFFFIYFFGLCTIAKYRKMFENETIVCMNECARKTRRTTKVSSVQSFILHNKTFSGSALGWIDLYFFHQNHNARGLNRSLGTPISKIQNIFELVKF
jgi:hypothetical protein